MIKIIIVMVLCLPTTLLADDTLFQYDAKGRRDPLWSLVLPNGTIMNYETDWSVADLELEGVIVDPSGNNLAVINGKIIKVNESIGLFIVSKIEKSRVTLSKEGETFILELKREDMR